MKQVVAGVGALLVILAWLAGIVLAVDGFKAVAIMLPPYAWYLVVERVMQGLGWAP